MKAVFKKNEIVSQSILLKITEVDGRFRSNRRMFWDGKCYDFKIFMCTYIILKVYSRKLSCRCLDLDSQNYIQNQKSGVVTMVKIKPQTLGYFWQIFRTNVENLNCVWEESNNYSIICQQLYLWEQYNGTFQLIYLWHFDDNWIVPHSLVFSWNWRM